MYFSAMYRWLLYCWAFLPRDAF